MYKLETIADVVAHPEPKHRDSCLKMMLEAVAPMCRNITINDPLGNGGLNVYGKVDPLMSLDDALTWDIPGLGIYDSGYVASISFILIDSEGREHHAYWEEEERCFQAFRNINLDEIII